MRRVCHRPTGICGRLNNDLPGTVLSRRRRITTVAPILAATEGDLLGARPVPQRCGRPTVRGPLPHSELHLLEDAGHHVQADEPERVAELITAEWHQETRPG